MLARERLALIAALLLIASLSGCGDSTPEPSTPKEIVDVPPALVVPTEDDQQEIRRPPEISGQLPSDFPADLPIYLPASLVDFGQGEDGRPWVELLTPHAHARVETELREKIRAAGWQQNGSSWSQGGRQVQVETRDGQPGTLIRITY